MSVANQILNSSVDFSIDPKQFPRLIEARADKTKPRDRLFQNSLCSFGAWTDFHVASVARTSFYQKCKGNQDLTMPIKDLFQYAHTDAITVAVNTKFCSITHTYSLVDGDDWRAVQIVKADQVRNMQNYPEQIRASVTIDGFLITAFNADGLVAFMPKEINHIKLSLFGMFEGATRWEVREWDNQDGTSKPKKALCSSIYGGQDPVFWGDDVNDSELPKLRI